MIFLTYYMQQTPVPSRREHFWRTVQVVRSSNSYFRHLPPFSAQTCSLILCLTTIIIELTSRPSYWHIGSCGFVLFVKYNVSKMFHWDENIKCLISPVRRQREANVSPVEEHYIWQCLIQNPIWPIFLAGNKTSSQIHVCLGSVILASVATHPS